MLNLEERKDKQVIQDNSGLELNNSSNRATNTGTGKRGATHFLLKINKEHEKHLKYERTT